MPIPMNAAQVHTLTKHVINALYHARGERRTVDPRPQPPSHRQPWEQNLVRRVNDDNTLPPYQHIDPSVVQGLVMHFRVTTRSLVPHNCNQSRPTSGSP